MPTSLWSLLSSWSPSRKPRGFVSVSTVSIFLVGCCAISLLISFWHGSFLMSTLDPHGVNDEHLKNIFSKLERPSLIPPPPPPLIKKPEPKSQQSAKMEIDVSLFGSAMLPSNLSSSLLMGVHDRKSVGHLNCRNHGGPLELEATQEMVYWQNIRQDEAYQAPFYDPQNPKYLTFEPDRGGFNNIRMAMETVLCLAVAMGRILVLPPTQKMYLLNKEKTERNKPFGFDDFFPMKAMAQHVQGLHIITMQEFLERQGHALKSTKTGQLLPPPDNHRTQWDGRSDVDTVLFPYLRQVGTSPANWDPKECMAAIPAKPGQGDATLLQIYQAIQAKGGFPSFETFVGNPTPVHGSIEERWIEHASQRQQLCLYDRQLQSQTLLHFTGKDQKVLPEGAGGGRLLTHFYTFLFFEDWKTDLWMKRFVRDHVRYNNDIQCAAARIVQAIRLHVHKRTNGKSTDFDAFHVRRGDFQYKKTRVSAQEMYDISKDEIPDGSTVYMATDEVRNKTFFNDLRKHYDLLFLDDFSPLIQDMSPNFYGMLDQLVAARSRTFFGCWFSTFTGYINRLRGYNADLHKAPGFAHGLINSYYYALADKKNRMREYWPISGAHYAREFPAAWRNIDHGIGEFTTTSIKAALLSSNATISANK